ncbi:MAG: radical SAM family heme chaperone HemW [Candidatus Omnitrophica bacterium]|nr:radical SAM family heme chaperone HemW [Candidatus Omnitrophota bacterium]
MLYIHIPFCRKKCPYCDFYSITYHQELAENYINVLSGQIAELDGRFSTIYIGGGTPSVLSWRLLAKLLESIKPSRKVEFTIEVNPESLDKEKLKLFLDNGVNRISIGVQSLRGDKLKKLERIHSTADALSAIDESSSAGFENISIDLMYGVWGETLSSWQSELKRAVTLPIQHISAYGLTIEKNTLLFNRGILLDDGPPSEMYKFNLEFLPQQGFNQYEVSNFSRHGFKCQHNLNYWENNSYVGVGAGAVSFKDGARTKNIADVNEYIARVKSAKTVITFSESLSALERAKETAAIKLRTKKGVFFSDFYQKTGFHFLEWNKQGLLQLLEDGLLTYRKNEKGEKIGVFPTSKGFLFCDTIAIMCL